MTTENAHMNQIFQSETISRFWPLSHRASWTHIDLVFWILTSPWGSKKEERDVWVAVRGHRYQGPEMSSTGPLVPSHPCWGDLVKLPSLAGTVAIVSSFLFSTERKSMTPLVVNQYMYCFCIYNSIYIYRYGFGVCIYIYIFICIICIWRCLHVNPSLNP